MTKASAASLQAILRYCAFSAVTAAVFTPGFLSFQGVAHAQAAPATGQVQMDPKEYEAYDNAVNKQTTPATQAPALESYLTAYPNSAVKGDVLQRLMLDYSQLDQAKAIATADKVLQLDPNNIRAYLIEVAFRRSAAEAMTDPAGRQSGLDAAASYATKGVAATKSKDMTDADFATLTAAAAPTFYSAIGTAALGKKDTTTAIDAFKKELAATKPEDQTKPGTALQDTYYLGQAYYQQPTPDYVNCTFYATRAYSYAPAQYQSQMPLAAYCYKKYHGGNDGYDAVVTAAKANSNPPSAFTIVPAPTPADQAAALLKSTKEEDLPKLAISDKEYVMQYGKPEDAEKIFATIKGKTTEVPGATVISATAEQLMLAVSDDAVQSKTADFTVNLKTPLKTIPTVGSKVNVVGTYASYTPTPVMIIMNEGEELAKKAAAPARAAGKAAPAHKGAAHRR